MCISEGLSRNIRFANILGHLESALPRIDAEVGGTVVATSSLAPRVNGERPVSRLPISS